MNVVLPEPGVNVVVEGGPASPSAAARQRAAAAATPTAAASGRPGRRWRSGWGTFKGQVVFDGAPPSLKVFKRRARRKKTPKSAQSTDRSSPSAWSSTPATKGVKNVLVYLPRPTAVNEDAKKAMAGKEVMFDQKKCIFEPHVLGLMVGETVTLKSSDPVNHNVNVKLKESTFNQTIAGGQAPDYPLAGAESTPGAGRLRYSPLDEARGGWCSTIPISR